MYSPVERFEHEILADLSLKLELWPSASVSDVHRFDGTHTIAAVAEADMAVAFTVMRHFRHWYPLSAGTQTPARMTEAIAVSLNENGLKEDADICGL
jgi:hypothetical protein